MNFKQLAESVFIIDDFMSRRECLDYMVISEQAGYEAAKVNIGNTSQVRAGVRNNNRAFYKSEELARTLWEKLQPFVPAQLGNSASIGLNELFRFYRYQRGQQFKGHFDESYVRNEREMSFYTFMVYLNDNFVGGDTTFRELRVRPKQGTALVFLHNLYHEGTEVTQGVKYVLRSDIMYRVGEAG